MRKLGGDCKPSPLPLRLALAQAPHEFFILLCGSQAKYPDFPFLCSRFPTQLCYHGYIHRHCPATSTSPAYRTFCNSVPKAVVAAGQTSASGCSMVTMSPSCTKALRTCLRACCHCCQPVEGPGHQEDLPSFICPITPSSENLPPVHILHTPRGLSSWGRF